MARARLVRRRVTRAVLAGALVATLAACAGHGVRSTGSPQGPGESSPRSDRGTGIFTAPQAWTKDVSTLPASPRSAAILAALVQLGGWGNGNRLQTDFAIPLLRADATTPRRTVTGPADDYCYGGPDCDPVPLQMPLPPDGNAEGSTDYTCDTTVDDCHVLVVAPDERKLYELYNATGDATSLTALGAFVWDLTRTYPDGMRGDQCTSADAAGFPVAALLPTADEVAAGEIPHALRFVLPNDRIKAGVFVHPAGHAGGPTSENPDAPPYGVRLRLAASFDESAFGASERVVLKALKTHGMLLADGGEIALTFADDRHTDAKWADLGIDAQSFSAIGPESFEVVDLGPEIDLTYECAR
ncbi:MAG: hypothetical protein AB7J32_05780 [Pseudonocardia sp.]